jgi:arylsulfatase A-like enzyme
MKSTLTAASTTTTAASSNDNDRKRKFVHQSPLPVAVEKPKNILLIIADQYKYPGNKSNNTYGFDDDLKEILGFHENISKDNKYKDHFPGLLKLRENAIVLKKHTIASVACVPSRAALFTG